MKLQAAKVYVKPMKLDGYVGVCVERNDVIHVIARAGQSVLSSRRAGVQVHKLPQHLLTTGIFGASPR